jgi:cytochrome c-type biogenesis protein CcmH/NrfF
VAVLLAVLAALVGAPAVTACPRTSVADLEDEVMCPVCGTPLALATEAPQAQREREFIQRLVDDCRSKEEIKDALVAQFGEEVLALPEDEGFDLAAYVVPGLGVLAAATAIGFAAVGWRRRRSGPGPEAPPEDAAAARLDEDMGRYDL